jgi:hypothetical protein
MRRFLVVFAFAFSFFLTAASAFGQVQITTGSIQGTVVDEKGGAVVEASVEARNLDTNLLRNVMTDSDGRFAFLSLPPGNYTITVSKTGFATIVQTGAILTIGQTMTLPVTMKVSATQEKIEVSATPDAVDTVSTASSSTLDELAVSDTPILGRKFEDLLTLTPGVSIVQGPDGDEININGQRGIFNNISLDGGDYNNGFFGEQMGGQRAAVDITLEAVKEFQIVASGANAEFGRTAGGVVNVITKSGTNDIHGSAFGYFRTEALTAATSDGKPLKDFKRQQFGGSLGGPIAKDKLFFFVAGEGVREDLTRDNLSAPLGAACSKTSGFVVGADDALINSSPECQRVALIDFFKTAAFPAPFKNTDESLPVDHQQRNASVFGRVDYNLNAKNQIFGSYSFDWSKNPNQTFDVPTYGTSANGIEGPSKIQDINTNWYSTLSPSMLNEAHFTYARENRPRLDINTSAVPDTSMGFAPNFRFGQPYFLEPGVDEIFWRTDVRDNFSFTQGKHTWKFGGEWIHSVNSQTFRGFFSGRYLFDSVTGFMHYVTQGPTFKECADSANPPNITLVVGVCPPGTKTTGPLLLFLQHGPAVQGESFDASGASTIKNEDFSIFVQDTWKIGRNLNLNYGLRWDAQHFPNPTIPPSSTAYGSNLSNPNFPSNGFIPNQNKEFQPRVGFAWDIFGNGKSALRASWGIFYARQNMLTQVGAITTNGVQQQSFTAGSAFGTPPAYGTNAAPIQNPPAAGTPPPAGVSVTVFSKDYENPRIYSTNVGFEQQLVSDYAVYLDFSMSKGVHLTRFIDPNKGASTSFACAAGSTNIAPGVCQPSSGDVVIYPSDVIGSRVAKPFANLGSITDTVSSAKSLYRGFTVGMRKRMSHRFLFDGNYTYSVDRDDDSNERDPFTFRYANLFNINSEYSYSDRDERHKFNFYTVADLPWGFNADVRMQAHSAQPITDNSNGDGTGAPCSINNSKTRFVNGIDCGRNHLRKDNAFFTFDFGVARPIKFGERLTLTPKLEMFNTFNNKNNVNPLSTPALFNFDGFLREGVGDPRQAQLSVRVDF